MRQSVRFLFLGAGVLCALCSGGYGSERKGTAGTAPRPAKSRTPSYEIRAAGGESIEALAVAPYLDGAFEATATEHFVILHEPGAAYVAGACLLLEYAYDYFYEVFSQAGFDLSPPKERLVWICFPKKSSFSRYAFQVEGMDLSWLDGYYSTLTNRVAVVQTDQKTRQREEAGGLSKEELTPGVAKNRSPREGVGSPTPSTAFGDPVLAMSAAGQQFDLTRLTHEVAHQLAFNCGIQKRGIMYPLWVSEGLATNFEFGASADIGLEYCNAARCKGLVEAYHAGELVPLRQFVVQTTVPPDARVGRRHYAQAWGFFQFILTERPESLRLYLRRLADLRPYRRDGNTMLAEFTEAFGSPESLERSWNAFLARQARHVVAAAHSGTADTSIAPAP